MVKFVASDGRAFTDYRPSCQINDNIQRGSGQMNEREYRMYLQHNAAKLIEQNRIKADASHKMNCHCPTCDSAVAKKNIQAKHCPKCSSNMKVQGKYAVCHKCGVKAQM